ncbi:MAG: glycyl-radical enzyme activating protein [Gemmatimonadetes bacterium]|nr:glycyl-radical enzyme activating protein [Gemmatimonadota bacterium]NIO30584.1 glycyl-radical enzyme activating protein [Gemmatimonadota bacterium]
MQTGTIFDIKKFAIHDGPGVRTTVFLKGCPLGCWLCHNPESQSFEPELMIRDGRCTRCGDCIEECAEGAVSLNGNSIRIDRCLCDLCGACADVCVAEAIEVAGRDVTVAELMEELERDVVYYDESGGGVTVSGGEPFAQPDFLLELLKSCKSRGIETAVDTCGHVAPHLFRSVAEHVDLFLYDLKVVDDERHREFTGVGVESIHENLRWLAEKNRAVIVRFPLLPGVSDDEANIHSMGEFLSSLANRPRVDILPYHRAGVDKYGRLDREPRLPDAEPPSEEEVAAVARRLSDFGLNVTVRGESL